MANNQSPFYLLNTKWFLYLAAIAIECLPLKIVADKPLTADYQACPITHIRTLDKVTGKTTDLYLKQNEKTAFREFDLCSSICYRSDPTEPDESIAYLTVRKKNTDILYYEKWVFSSSPSQSPFTHPLYDLWLVECLPLKTEKKLDTQEKTILRKG